MRTNIVKVTLGRLTTVSKKQLWKEDYGQKIQFIGVDLPYRYEVDFADSPTGQAITMIGDEAGVLVPDELLQKEGNIYAYLYLHTGADDGETQYTVILPVEQRAERTDIEPTPVQQNIIEQTIVALNDAVEKTAADVVAADASAQAAAGSAEAAGQAKDDAVEAKDDAETAQGKAEDAQRAAEQAAGSVLGLTADATVDANVGIPSVEVDVVTEADHKKMVFAFHNLKGGKGDQGVGISSVILNPDYTLTITLTNGTSYTTSSIRGEVGATPNLTIGTVSTLPEGTQATATITGTDEDPVLNLGIPVGDTGDPGISPTITVTEITGGHEVAVTDAQGTQSFDVLDGEVSEEQLETALIDKADVITSSASGEIVTIADGGDNLPIKGMTIQLLPVQSGSGDPSPSNTRPISGWTGVDVYQSGADTSNPTTYPISWQSSAGTVYGCNIDPVSGRLTVDYKINTLTSFGGAWGSYSNGYAVYVSVSGSAHSGVNAQLMKCNYFAYSGLGYNSMPVYSYGGTSGSTATHTFILPTTITSLAEANAWLASLDEPVQFMTKLSTPLVYQLSETQIATYLGVNNFWSNGNGSLDLEYRCDTKLYIENLTKPSEDDMTANANIASGKFFMVGNRLMLSTTAIAQGEQIVVGTNCTEVSLADALNTINS